MNCMQNTTTFKKAEKVLQLRASVIIDISKRKNWGYLAEVGVLH